MKPKRCKHCDRPVYKTISNLGYCRKCIALAREQQQPRAREHDHGAGKIEPTYVADIHR